MKKTHTEKEIRTKLGCANLMIDNGRTTLQAVRAIGISVATYYRWRRKEALSFNEVKPFRARIIGQRSTAGGR